MRSFVDLRTELDTQGPEPLNIFIGTQRELIDRYCGYVFENNSALKVNSFESILPRIVNKGFFLIDNYIIENDTKILEMEIEDVRKLLAPAFWKGKDTRVVFIFPQADFRKAFFKTYESSCFDFENVPQEHLVRYVTNQLGVSKSVATTLVDKIGLNLGAVVNEVDKLLMLESEEEIYFENAVSKGYKDIFFPLLNAIQGRDEKEMWRLWRIYKEQNEPIVKLTTTLYTSFRNLLLVQGYSDFQDYEISKKTGLNTKMIYRIRSNVGRYPTIKIISILEALQKLDYQIKTGYGDPVLLVEKFFMTKIFVK